MATAAPVRTRTVPRRAPAAPAPTVVAPQAPAGSVAVDIHRRLVWEYIDLSDIVPYAFNPRDNEKAIPEIMASIQLVGFTIPIVLDRNNIIVAGHTRVEAAKRLGMVEVPALRAHHCTDEQLTAFRLIDNKVSESASWNFELLGAEMASLQGTGIDWKQFGWTQNDIDCLTDVVQADCLDAAGAAQEVATQSNPQDRRAPVTARMVLGEVVFFMPAAVYRTWVDGLRQLHDFNELAIVNDIKRRLGIVE